MQYNINIAGTSKYAKQMNIKLKIHKHECMTVEKILPLQQHWTIEQVKFSYSSPGEELEKQTKTIGKAREK